MELRKITATWFVQVVEKGKELEKTEPRGTKRCISEEADWL